MKLMANEGGKNDKWMIMKADDKMIIWTNVIFLKIVFYNIFFWRNPMGASYVDMTERIRNKDDLTMLCEQSQNILFRFMLG